MFRLRVKFILITAGLFFLFSSCGFVDLRSVNFTTIPGEPDAVLSQSYSPVIVRFDTDMMQKETESVLQVLSAIGSVDGSIFWKGNALYFVPTSPWMPGYRYILKISGDLYTRDGREFTVLRELPFYAFTRVPLPYLVSSDPPDGASTETFFPGERIITFRFSLPMNKRSIESHLTINGISKMIYSWYEDDRVLEIYSPNPLAPWTNYRWSLPEKILSRDKAPLAKAVSGRFITDRDRDFPHVVKVQPLFRQGGNSSPCGVWLPAASDLKNGLGLDQGIGVEFSKPMDTEKLKSAFGFEPHFSGRVEILSQVSAVFIPDRNPEPESIFTMEISGDVRDLRGLKMGEDYKQIFFVEYPFLNITTFVINEDSLDENSSVEFTNPKNNQAYPATVDSADNGVLRFTLRFSLPFSPEAQKEITSISLSPFFPNTLSPPRLRYIRWFGNDVYMEWEGVVAGKDSEPHYYRLNIPSGRGGISNGKGSYFKEAVSFFLEAK